LPKDGIFLEGATLTGLLIVSLAHSRDLAMSGDNQDADNNLHDFAKELLKMGRQCGMRIAQDIRIPRPLSLQGNDDIGKEIEAVVRRDRDWCRQNGQTPANLVLVILPTDAAKNPAYAEVKKVADVVLGIATQCLKPKWVKGMAPGDGGNRHGGDRGRGGRVGGRGGRGGYGGSQAPRRTGPSLFSQIILKVNAKLGGRNTIVEGGLPIVDLEPTMVVGIDATHPPPNSTAFSIAAVVSSIDRYCTMYRTAIAVIPARTETLLDLDEMILDQMTLFQIHNNTFPSRIIVFRDGVSEGQFQNVVDGEVVRIKTAARFVSERTGLRYEPKITFIVVQKRHHTRLFCDQENSDRNGNAFPGTVIDSGIVNPDTFEFYMYSHPGLQGTSRPTKYQVLYDENGFSSDDLQALVYRLCFQYARSQRAVSLPPPV
jgi:eukaryotic translation initiation factor 2C